MLNVTFDPLMFPPVEFVTVWASVLHPDLHTFTSLLLFISDASTLTPALKRFSWVIQYVSPGDAALIERVSEASTLRGPKWLDPSSVSSFCRLMSDWEIQSASWVFVRGPSCLVFNNQQRSVGGLFYLFIYSFPLYLWGREGSRHQQTSQGRVSAHCWRELVQYDQ